jgi:hypothetical protein
MDNYRAKSLLWNALSKVGSTAQLAHALGIDVPTLKTYLYGQKVVPDDIRSRILEITSQADS